MTSAEVVDAMKGRVPVLYDHPFYGVLLYKRIKRVEYMLTGDLREPSNSHDGVTVSVQLEDKNGHSSLWVDPKYVHGYTREEYERRKRAHEAI